MEERKQFVRLDARLEMTYTVLPSGKAQRAVAKDISGGGISFCLEQPIPPGTRLQVALKLPDREPPVNFTAEVMWCETYEMIGRTERHRTAEAGVRFIEISPADQEAVMQYVTLRCKPGRPAG